MPKNLTSSVRSDSMHVNVALHADDVATRQSASSMEVPAPPSPSPAPAPTPAPPPPGPDVPAPEINDPIPPENPVPVREPPVMPTPMALEATSDGRRTRRRRNSGDGHDGFAAAGSLRVVTRTRLQADGIITLH
ncbi:hypothetical protein BH09PSE5_BH09PSE5_39260 [soil metagenome]